MSVLGFDRQRERGAAAVELALILPILAALLFGIIEFGLAFNTQIALTQAAREGVRVEALGTGDPDQTTRDAFLGAIGAGGADLDSPILIDGCPGSDKDKAKVRASLSYNTVLLNFGPFDLSGEAVMRCGG